MARTSVGVTESPLTAALLRGPDQKQGQQADPEHDADRPIERSFVLLHDALPSPCQVCGFLSGDPPAVFEDVEKPHGVLLGGGDVVIPPSHFLP